jgi:hypothetical protein
MKQIHSNNTLNRSEQRKTSNLNKNHSKTPETAKIVQSKQKKRSEHGNSFNNTPNRSN